MGRAQRGEAMPRFAVLYVFDADDDRSGEAIADAAWYAMEDAGAVIHDGSARRVLRSGTEPVGNWPGWSEEEGPDFRFIRGGVDDAE